MKACEYNDHHCLTCSDEAIPVRILHIDAGNGLALVAAGDKTEEIDITLVEDIAVGDIVLAHGGVAIAPFAEVRGDG